MQQFPVPKYIDLEAHILGPLSISQTVTVILGGGIVMLLYVTLETFLFVPAAILIAIVALVVSFAKVNGRPMSDFFLNVISYSISPHIYVWTLSNKKAAIEQKKVPPKKKSGGVKLPASSSVTPEQIHALAKQLDVLKK